MPRNNTKIIFLFSMILGCLVWILSNYFTGKIEPWDAVGYYLFSLFFSGFLGGFFGKKYFWLWPLAIILGQILTVIFFRFIHPPLGANFFIPLGLIALLIYSVSSFIGSILGVWLSKIISK